MTGLFLARSMWIALQNPERIASANHTFAFDDQCHVSEGDGQGHGEEEKRAGTQCPIGGIFFISRADYELAVSGESKKKQAEKELRKKEMRELLGAKEH